MLFLLPALEAGMAGAAAAVRRSLAWNLGANQLGEPLVVREPFQVYRSLERCDGMPRARRYLRTLLAARRSGPAQLLPDERLRINREVRSYHLGWILYVWSGRSDEPALTP